jgi:type VII secretion integral membrane protein EccD
MSPPPCREGPIQEVEAGATGGFLGGRRALRARRPRSGLTNPSPTHRTNPNPTHHTNPNPTHRTNPSPTHHTNLNPSHHHQPIQVQRLEGVLQGHAQPEAAARGAAMTTPPVNKFCRIGVAGPRGRVDLAVPFGIPLARLLTALLRHVGEQVGQDGGASHGGWVVRGGDGARLDAARSLRDLGVREGDLLFLTHGADADLPPRYDDVVEIIGDAGGDGWTRHHTRLVSAVLAGIATLAIVLAVAGAPGALPGVLGLVTAALLCGVGGLLSRAFGDITAGGVTVALAAPVAAVAAAKLLGPGVQAGHLLLAAAVLAAVAALGSVLVGGADGLFAALLVAALLGVVGVVPALAWHVDAVRCAAVAASLALGLVTFLPPVALGLARVPSAQLASTAEELAAITGELDFAHLKDKVDRARVLLAGLLTGVHAAIVVGVIVLLAAGGTWPLVLALVLTTLVLLRTRLFRHARLAAVPWVAAAIVLLAAAGILTTRHAGDAGVLLGTVAPVALAVAVAAGGVALASGRFRTDPRLARTLDVVETVLLLATIPLILAVWHIYSAVLDLST